MSQNYLINYNDDYDLTNFSLKSYLENNFKISEFWTDKFTELVVEEIRDEKIRKKLNERITNYQNIKNLINQYHYEKINYRPIQKKFKNVTIVDKMNQISTKEYEYEFNKDDKLYLYEVQVQDQEIEKVTIMNEENNQLEKMDETLFDFMNYIFNYNSIDEYKYLPLYLLNVGIKMDKKIKIRIEYKKPINDAKIKYVKKNYGSNHNLKLIYNCLNTQLIFIQLESEKLEEELSIKVNDKIINLKKIWEKGNKKVYNAMNIVLTEEPIFMNNVNNVILIGLISDL